MTEPTTSTEILFEERLAATRRDWRWLPAVVVASFLAVAPIVGGIAALAWLWNVVRFARTRVVVGPDHLTVGKRTVRLSALELSTLGQAGNTWPWRAFNRRYLGANPFWTDDSVGVRGLDFGKRYWVAIGTNRRAELVDVLNRAIPEARTRAVEAGTWSAQHSGGSLTPSGWHADPWAPEQLRWWDGEQWTHWTAPKQGAPPPDAGGDR